MQSLKLPPGHSEDGGAGGVGGDGGDGGDGGAGGAGVDPPHHLAF